MGSRVVLLVVAMAVLAPGAAQAARASMQLDANDVQVGESITLKLSVTDGAADHVPAVAAPPEVRITYQGQSQSLVSVNFRTTRTVIYQYGVAAVKAGTVTIGPAMLTSGGAPLTAPAVQLVIRERSSAARSDSRVDAKLEPDSGSEGHPAEVYVGQTVVYHFVFRHVESLVDARWSPPDFKGFTPVPTDQQGTREYRVTENGQAIAVHEIDMPLIVTSPGTGEIPPGVITAQFAVESRRGRSRNGFESLFDQNFGVFTDTKEQNLAGPAIPFRAIDLPREGRPAGFSGLVGTFQVESELGATSVKVGDSATLTVRITGDGNLAGFKLPPAAADASFRVYDDAPVVTSEVHSGHFTGGVELKRALVPLLAGRQKVPDLAISWFDPEAGRYVVRTLEARELDVLPGEASAAKLASYAGAAAAQKEEVAALGSDILPVHASVRVRPHPLGSFTPANVGLFAVPALAWVGLLLRQRIGRGSGRGRQIRAIRRRLANLPAETPARNAAIESAFREATGLALGIPAASIEAERLAELPEALREEAEKLYQRVEMARYGASEADTSLPSDVLAFVGRVLGRFG